MRTLAVIFLVLPALVCPSFAQTTAAEITGQIADATGAAVPAAGIAVVNTETGARRETRSNETGAYSVPLLPPGSYKLTAQKDGFRPVTRTGIVLVVDQVARLDFTLELGTMAQSVEVKADAPLLDQETSSLGQVIDSSKIVNIPLNGRSPMRLVQLTPGVLGVPSSNGQFGDIPVNTNDDSIISINGGRAGTNEVLIDGIPSTTGFLNQMTTIPNVDATQEFKVQSNNLSAEYGRFAGGVINVSTRGGTNLLHGSLYEFLRNSAFDANEFFNKRAGSSVPAFRMNQYGFAAGGPVFLPKLYNGRNKTFFFADYQGSRWRQGAVFIGSVPTALQRAGDFTRTLNNKGQQIVIYDPTTTSRDPANAGKYVRTPFAGNVIPASRIDPIAAKLAGFYPAPNIAGDPLTGTNDYLSNAPTTIDQANFSIRLDHNLSDNQHLFGRVSSNRSTLGQPDTYGNVATPGVGANGKLYLNNSSGALDDSYVLSPKSVLDVRYGFARFFWARPTRSYGFDQRQLGFPASLTSQFEVPLFPVVGVADFSGLGGGSVLRTGQDTHSVLASLSRLMGNHSFKAGVDLRMRRLNTFNLGSGGGNYSFTRAMTQGPDPNTASATAGLGLASLLLGTASSGTVNIAVATALRDFYYAGYLQDDYRAGKRLTLNFGLRYETESPYTEARNQLNRFSFTAPNPASNPAFPDLKAALSFAGPNDRTVYNWDKNNFAPRFGFALTPTGGTVLRGGVGLFYSPFSVAEPGAAGAGFAPTSGFSSSTPMLASLDGLTPYNTLGNPFPGGLIQPVRDQLGAATFLGQGLQVWDPTAITPYTVQWNFDVQRQLPWKLTLDVAYAGSHGLHLQQTRQYDTLAPQYLALGTGLQTLVTNPFSGIITNGALAQPKVAQQQLLLPYPQYTGIALVNAPWGDSIYHSAAVKLERRFAQGFGFLLSYTGSKLISDVPDSTYSYNNSLNNGLNTNVQNWYNLRAERAVSELDVPQSLALSWVAELPFGPGKHFLSGARGIVGKLAGGWQISGITRHRSGYPLNLSAPVAGGGNRPNSTGISADLGGGRTRQEQIARWFNTAAFTLPPAFTYGNVGRTLPDVRGPALTSFDVSLVKDTRVYERLRVEFRAESFNLMNTPHLWLPNTAANSLQFGQINSTTGGARVMQLALKVLF